MNVILISFSFNNNSGGTERICSHLISKFKNVKFYTISEKNSDFNYSNQHHTSLDLNNIMNFKKLMEIVDKYDINYIINIMSENLITNLILSRIKYYRTIKIVQYLHVSPNYFFESIYDSKLIKKPFKYLIYFFGVDYFKFLISYNISHKFVVISEQNKLNLIKKLKLKKNNKVISIYNPLTYSDQISNEDFKNKKHIVLAVSRIASPLKRSGLLIKIWNDPRLINSNWELHIVGDGPLLNDLKEQSIHMRNVYFHGKINPIELYKSSKIFISTSKNEGFGLTLTEALQYNLIPIAFNSYETINEILLNNQNGFLIEENSITDFTDKLVDVITNYNDYYYLIPNQKPLLSKSDNSIYKEKFKKILSLK